jgi:hypothetical protein
MVCGSRLSIREICFTHPGPVLILLGLRPGPVSVPNRQGLADMSATNPSGAPSDLRKDSLTRLREQYAGEINTLISSLVNNYLNIISGSVIDINDPVCGFPLSISSPEPTLTFFSSSPARNRPSGRPAKYFGHRSWHCELGMYFHGYW